MSNVVALSLFTGGEKEEKEEAVKVDYAGCL